MLIHCPNCQTDQTSENKVCTRCGAPLEGLPQKKGEPTKKEPEVWHATLRPPVFSFAPLSSVEAETPAKPETPASPETAMGTKTAAGIKTAAGGGRGLLWKIPAALAILAAAALFLRADISQTSARTLPSNPAAPVSPPAAPVSPPAASALSASRVEAPAVLEPLPAVASPDASGPTVPPATPRSMPLVLTLGSDSRNRTLVVGAPVTISAAALLPPGRSATLVMFYQHDRGAKLLLAQAQGSLCRTVWTPTLPGYYKFTATALDDQRRVAAAPSLALRVTGPPLAPVEPVSVQPILARPAPLKVVSAPPPAMRRPSRQPPAAKHTAAKRVIPPHAPAVLPPIRFHVAAAAFPFERNAAVLASALHTRGFPAVVRKQKNSQGKTAYVVQTGVFPSAAEAHQQSLHLQRDGYPAYLYTSH